MDKLFDLIVPQLPGWSIIPAAAILLFFIAWPTLQAIWKEIVPSYRLYTREKMRLELLKLLYEVETLKKEHQLGDMESLLPQRFQQRETKDALTPAEHQKRLPSLEAILFGAVGGSAANMATILFRFVEDNLFLSMLTPMAVIGVLVGVILYGFLGGLIGVFSKPLTRTDAVLRGAAGVFVIFLFLTTLLRGGPAQHVS